MSLRSDRHTAISQLAHADEADHSFNKQFHLTVQIHFLSVNSCSPKGPGWLYMCEREKHCGKCFNHVVTVTVVGSYVSGHSNFSPANTFIAHRQRTSKLPAWCYFEWTLNYWGINSWMLLLLLLLLLLWRSEIQKGVTSLLYFLILKLCIGTLIGTGSELVL